MAVNNAIAGEMQEIYEYFPFWDTEEVNAMRAEKLKQQFMGVVESVNTNN